MYRIGVIGDPDSIGGFAALGFAVFPETDPVEAGHLLRRLAESDYAVLYITEALAAQLTREIARYETRRLPAIIPIPGVGVGGSLGLGKAAVHRSVERAVGSDILFGK